MIYTFVRHCNFSKQSANKPRPEWFDREEIFKKLLLTIMGKDDVKLTVVFDGDPSNHFVSKYDHVNRVAFNGGNDAKSFLNLLLYVHSLPLRDEDIVYFTEDDYLHKGHWDMIMKEGFDMIDPEYMTLYDCPDKYTAPMYEDLQSKVLATTSVHWRTTPSTTNTYACRFKTLKKHFGIHQHYCDLNEGWTRDHQKFLHLGNEGSNLMSCIPGYSTHVELPFLSPTIHWEVEMIGYDT